MKRLVVSALLCCGMIAGLAAQDVHHTQKDTKRRFGQLATRAVANFRSADSIEQRLHDDGASLHPQLIGLRLQIQATLDDSRAAMDSGDLKAANEALDRAQGFLDKFAKRLGGD